MKPWAETAGLKPKNKFIIIHMTTLYIFVEKRAAELTARIARLLDGRYAIQAIETESALREALPGSKQALVFTDLEKKRLLPLLRQCRSVLPATAFIGTLPETEPLAPLPDVDCHWLSASFTDFELLSRVASAAGQVELLDALANSAQRDEVSNLLNRRYFIQRASEEISLSKRHLSPLCVVILGIDYYRMYLDSYGYAFMNAMLRFLADQISGMIRHEDIVARLGDDEIAILLPRSTEAGAGVFTTRLVTHLNQLSFQHDAYVEDIAVSAGLVGYPLSDFPQVDADSLIRYGRHALHQAKSAPDGMKLCLFSEIRPAF